MDNVTQPTSMLGSGFMEEQQSPQEMASMLPPSMALPPEMLSMMAGAGVPQVNPGLAAGSGMLAGLAGRQGNPYLEQQQKAGAGGLGGAGSAQMIQLLRMQQQQQLIQQALQQREQQYQQTMEMRRSEALLKIGLESLKHDDPNLRAFGAQAVVDFAKKNRMFVGGEENIIKSLATKRLSHKDLDKIMIESYRGLDDQTLMTRWPGLDSPVLTALKTAMTNPDEKTRALLNIKSPTDIKKEALELQSKEIDLIKSKFPELTGKYGAEASMVHRRLNGKDYSEGDQTSRDQAIALSKSQMLGDELKTKEAEAMITERIRAGYQEQANVNAERRQDLKQQLDVEKLQIKQQLDIEKANAIKKEKVKQDLTVAKTFIQQFEDSISVLDKKGFLPKDSGVLEKGRANVKQGRVLIPGVSQPNDPDWRTWNQLQGNMVGWARNVEGEIGARFKGAFEASMGAVSDPPTAEGLRQIAKQMRQQLTAAEKGEPYMPPTPNGPLGSLGTVIPSTGPLGQQPPAALHLTLTPAKMKQLRDAGVTDAEIEAYMKQKGTR